MVQVLKTDADIGIKVVNIPPKSLALVGVNEKDTSVLISLIELLAVKLSHAWQITKSTKSPDRILIDLDDSRGHEAWQTYAEMGPKRIALFTCPPPPEDAQLSLHKPIRARDLVHVLEFGAESAESTNTDAVPSPASSIATDVLVRLKRWPDPKFISGQIELARLSAVLTRRALTLQHAADAAQTSLETAMRFALMCRDQGWLSESIALDEAPPTTHSGGGRQGLFSSIRAKLGLSS